MEPNNIIFNNSLNLNVNTSFTLVIDFNNDLIFELKDNQNLMKGQFPIACFIYNQNVLFGLPRWYNIAGSYLTSYNISIKDSFNLICYVLNRLDKLVPNKDYKLDVLLILAFYNKEILGEDVTYLFVLQNYFKRELVTQKLYYGGFTASNITPINYKNKRYFYLVNRSELSTIII